MFMTVTAGIFISAAVVALFDTRDGRQGVYPCYNCLADLGLPAVIPGCA